MLTQNNKKISIINVGKIGTMGRCYEINFGVIYLRIWSSSKSFNRLTPNFYVNYSKKSLIALGSGANTMNSLHTKYLLFM